MKLAIASEHAGYNLKSDLLNYLEQKSIEVVDMGSSSDKPVEYHLLL